MLNVLFQGGGWYVYLYNPWGTDGPRGAFGEAGDPTRNDGLVAVSWATFAANFEDYTATRR